ncbi:hypothetical protein OWV82_013806 [Melia azedarach]|uniref:Uncharacterized protein n=1 Tax=Melia azedarach TaxID=155640 RepID=A0ACC1XVA7_MELAZ|nr:hypothetical protein OWV82_013806 [Melia azedarach]
MTENTSIQSYSSRVFNCDSEILTEREHQWLDSIMKEKDQTDQNLKQKIPKVPEMLRRIEANKDCFDPLVVSIGPYHHGKPELKFMEECKVKMAKQYANNDAEFLQRMYKKLKYHAAKDARNCYGWGLINERC